MKILHAGVFFAALVAAQHSAAALIERDWLSQGDGLLTYDSRTGLEWLDISQTQLENFPAGPLVEDRYQAVVAETLPGGRFEGFLTATSRQANDLAISVGVDTEVPTFEVNEAGAAKLLLLIGIGVSTSEGARTYGLLEDLTPGAGDTLERSLVAIARDTVLDPTPDAYVRIYPGVRLAEPYPHGDYGGLGVMLARTAVPEPATAALVVLAIAGLHLKSWR